MHSPATVGTLSAQQLKGTFVTLQQLGVPIEPILASCGLVPASLDNPFARFGVDVEHRLWTAIERASGDPAIGLRIGTTFAKRGRFELDIFLALNSGTVRRAFLNLQPLVRLADDRGHVDVSEDAVNASIAIRRDGGYPRAAGAIDVMFSNATTLLFERVPDFRLTSVSFTRARPRDVRPYVEVFGLEPCFDAERNAIHFDRALLDAPLRGSDAALAEVLVRYAAHLAERAPSLDPLLSRVQSVLSSGLSLGKTSLSIVARATGTSPRTLRRRLASLDTSFQRVLDGLRRDMASHHLRDGSESVAQIGERLGFASTSAFQRAFQRWFGKPPSTYRSEARSGAMLPGAAAVLLRHDAS
jgi:AraC-like DNA-binding protein